MLSLCISVGSSNCCACDSGCPFIEDHARWIWSTCRESSHWKPTAAVSAVFIADLLQASEQTILSLAPKVKLTPIAMGIAERVGGLPSLTAVCVIKTGVIGAMFGPYILNAARITSWRARGFAMGVAAHGIGTARAIQVNQNAGAFASLAVGLNGPRDSDVPILYALWQWWSG